MTMNCQVCNKRMPVTFQGDICSDACRAKKSRAKRGSQAKAYGIGFQVDAFAKMLSDGTIGADEARSLLDAFYDRTWAFWEQIQAAKAKEERLEEEAKTKKKKR